MRLEPGQSLLLYTDGIIEAQADSHEFGLAGLLALVRKGDAREGPLLDAILTAVREHLGPRPAADDMTLLVAKPVSDRRRSGS